MTGNRRSGESVLLSVWREVGRHIEIEEATREVARLLSGCLPLKQLAIRKLDEDHQHLETLALGLPASGDDPLWTKTVLTERDVKIFKKWVYGNRRVQPGSYFAKRSELGFLLPSRPASCILIGPLGDMRHCLGIALWVASNGRDFTEADMDLASELLEPLAVALENDQRLRELAVLREAAEADKERLLSRLGRRELSDTIVGTEGGLRLVMERVELVAKSDAPVLLLGETGSGKELIARTIHQKSRRCAGPFIRINCGAIPPELVDSELFGHERGAFTGAVSSRKGWFERAHGGTLLLDEVGELPLAAQVRLLRVLQDGWLERVGGHAPIHVDVRIIAATNRDLARMVDEGKFREDLWYRIAVFPIRIPPLRERSGDIPDLVRHFARRAAIRFGLKEVAPTDEDLKLLVSYPWPGNIRELAAVIDRAAILGNGLRLEVAQALGIGRDVRPGSPMGPVAPRSNEEPCLSLDEAIRRHIEAALRRCSGQIEGRGGAASLLKINPSTLRAKMRKLGVEWQRFRSVGNTADSATS